MVKNNFSIFEVLLGMLFVLIGVVTRGIPHDPNFTALVAISLLSGFFIKDPRIVFWLGLLLLRELVAGH